MSAHFLIGNTLMKVKDSVKPGEKLHLLNQLQRKPCWIFSSNKQTTESRNYGAQTEGKKQEQQTKRRWKSYLKISHRA